MCACSNLRRYIYKTRPMYLLRSLSILSLLGEDQGIVLQQKKNAPSLAVVENQVGHHIKNGSKYL